MKRLLLALPFLLTACEDPVGAKRVLELQGYYQIQITGYRDTGCNESDVFRTGFRAIGPGQLPVTGVVCRGMNGLGKGSTVRID